MKLLPPVIVLMLLAPPAVAAEPLGRLFYTPDQRASLDVARSKRARTVVATEKTEEAPPPPPSAEIVTYGGVVRRSDGKTTVWLNNRAVTGKESPDAKMVGRIRPDGTVTLQSPQTGRNVELKVGQRAELLSGRVEEGYRQVQAAKPESQPDPAAAGKPDAATSQAKPPADAGAAEAERRRDERERLENLDDAVRALRDAAAARSAETAPPQQPAGAPAQAPAQPYK